MPFTGADQSHCPTPWGRERGGGGAGKNLQKLFILFFVPYCDTQVTGYELNIAPVMFSEHVIFVYLSI